MQPNEIPNMEPVTVELSQPIQAHGETIHQLTIHPPKVKHLKMMDAVKGDTQKTIVLVSALANIPQSSVEEVTGFDMAQKIAPVISNFLGASQETGEN